MSENSGNNCSTAPATVPSALHLHILIVLRLATLSAQPVKSLLIFCTFKKGSKKKKKKKLRPNFSYC